MNPSELYEWGLPWLLAHAEQDHLDFSFVILKSPNTLSPTNKREVNP